MIIRCNLCRSIKIKELFVSQNIHGRFLLSKKDKFDILKCVDCNNVFLGNININSNYYKKYYPKNYYRVDLGNSILNFLIKIMDIFSFKMKERLILSKLEINKNINILDIGCGIGSFLNQLDNIKFKKYGVEINKKGANLAKKKGIIVYNSDVLKLRLNKKFDVITMWHVLEHIYNPEQVIKKVYQLLNKNGLLVIAVPNSDCIGFNYGKKYYYHLDSPRHIFIPNRSNLTDLLTKNYFEIVKIVYEFYDYPIDLFISVRNSFIKYLVYPLYPFIKLFDRETLTFIALKH